jgi:hypothetical protein
MDDRYRQEVAELHALQGWISLEAGHLAQAREHLELAEATVGARPIDYDMRPLVLMGLKWLNDNAR